MSRSRAKWTRKACIYFLKYIFFHATLIERGLGVIQPPPEICPPPPPRMSPIYFGALCWVSNPGWLTHWGGGASIQKEKEEGKPKQQPQWGEGSVHSIIGGWQQRGRGFDKYHGKCEKVSKLRLYFRGKLKLDVFFGGKNVKRRSFRPPTPHPTPGAPNFFVTLAGGAISKKKKREKSGRGSVGTFTALNRLLLAPSFPQKRNRKKKRGFFLSSLRGVGGPPQRI